MNAEYSEAHRVFLTYIRCAKAVNENELIGKFLLLAKHFDIEVRDDPVSDLRDFVAAINIQLEAYSFKIDTISDQETGILQYVFINTKFDDVIQGCTPFTAPELDAIKQLIDNIVNSHAYAFCIPQVNAKQHVAAVLKQRASEADFFIRRLIDDGWIELTRQNRVALSSTSLSELKEYLVDRFGIFSTSDPSGKMLICHVCNGFVTLGHKCSKQECPSAFHLKCLVVYQRDTKPCPNRECGSSLEHLVGVGPRVDGP